MKRYLKFIAFLVIMSLFVMGLYGCGGETGTSETENLRKQPTVKVRKLLLINATPEGKVFNLSNEVVCYTDGVVEIRCFITDEGFLYEKLFPVVEIGNLTEDILVIDWNTASFAGPSGRSHRVAYEGMRYIKAMEEVPPVTLAPFKRFKTTVFAADLVRWEYYPKIGGMWISNSPLEGYEEPKFTLVIPVKKSGETTYYVLEYQIEVYEKELPLLSAPQLYTPSDGETVSSVTPTFSWSSVEGARGYWLIVATDPSHLPDDPFTTSAPNAVISINVRKTSYTPEKPLNYDTTYYWEVQSFNDSYNPICQGQYSEKRSFKTPPKK